MIYILEIIATVLYFTSCIYFLFFTEYTLFEGLVIGGILLVVALFVGELYIQLIIERDDEEK